MKKEIIIKQPLARFIRSMPILTRYILTLELHALGTMQWSAIALNKDRWSVLNTQKTILHAV